MTISVERKLIPPLTDEDTTNQQRNRVRQSRRTKGGYSASEVNQMVPSSGKRSDFMRELRESLKGSVPKGKAKGRQKTKKPKRGRSR